MQMSSRWQMAGNKELGWGNIILSVILVAL